MELLLGSHVREYGSRVGRLAGFEMESSGALRRILFRTDSQTTRRAASAIALVHDSGEIEMRPPVEQPMPSIPEAVLLTSESRLLQDGRPAGSLLGIDVDPSSWSVASLFVRRHWWSRRESIPMNRLDWSTPGEIRLAAAPRAA